MICDISGKYSINPMCYVATDHSLPVPASAGQACLATGCWNQCGDNNIW